MPVELGVLGGHECVAHDRRDFVHRYQVALLEEELADELAVVGVDTGRYRRVVGEQLAERRKPQPVLVVERETDRTGADAERQHAREEYPAQSSH